MGWINRLFGSTKPAPDDDYWYQPVGGRSWSGQAVSAESAMQLSAVYACVRVLAETIASLPIHIYRRLSDGGKQRAPEHPLYRVLHDQPNAWQTSFSFREMLMSHLALRGNGYARIDGSPAGLVRALLPLHPSRVVVKQLDSGRLSYEYRPPKGAPEILTQDEVLHLRGLSDDGVVGLSPIAQQRESIGMGLAALDYGARFFKNDARPGGYFKVPAGMTPEQEKVFRDSWTEAQSGANRHRPAIMKNGMEWVPVTLTQEDAQFIETRKLSRSEIAAIFRVPPHLIGDLERSTFSNIEHQSIDFVVHTIRPWLIRWEQQLAAALLPDDDEFFIEFLVDGLLRGDIASRYAAYAVGINWGWLSPNEVRRFETLNAREGGDLYLQPVNMAPSGSMPGNPGQKPEPRQAPPKDEDASAPPRKLEVVHG